MNTHYTDVDQMIFRRWEEISALRDAYDDLMDRMGESMAGVCGRVENWLGEQGYESYSEPKGPEITAWKAGWEKPRGQGLVVLYVGDFAPLGYGKVGCDHPYLWVNTEGLDRIRLKDPDRVRFARDLKAALGPAVTKWEHQDCDQAAEPLGRYRTDINEMQRVELAAHPARLVEFVQTCFTELFELTPIIDDTLKKYRDSRCRLHSCGYTKRLPRQWTTASSNGRF
jgi:hypothetical protein